MRMSCFFTIIAIVVPAFSYAKDTSRVSADKYKIFNTTRLENGRKGGISFLDLDKMKKDYDAKLAEYELGLKKYEAQKAKSDESAQSRILALNSQVDIYNNTDAVIKEPTIREESTQMHLEVSIAHHAEYLKVADATRDTNEVIQSDFAYLQQQYELNQAKWQEVREMELSYSALVEEYNAEIERQSAHQ